MYAVAFVFEATQFSTVCGLFFLLYFLQETIKYHDVISLISTKPSVCSHSVNRKDMTAEQGHVAISPIEHGQQDVAFHSSNLLPFQMQR